MPPPSPPPSLSLPSCSRSAGPMSFSIRNWRTTPSSCRACSLRLAAAAADSCTSAAFCWVMSLSWLTAALIWPRPEVCSVVAASAESMS